MLQLQKYPASFKLLRTEVRNKAIKIAQNLIDKDFPLNIAYNIAYSNAGSWAKSKDAREDLDFDPDAVHLVKHPMAWLLISNSGEEIYFAEPDKAEAMKAATTLGKQLKLKVFIHSDEGFVVDYFSFEVNRPLPGKAGMTVKERPKVFQLPGRV